MSNNSNISKHVDPEINQIDSSGEPANSVENSENGHSPNAEDPKGTGKPNDKHQVSSGEDVSNPESQLSDQPDHPAADSPSAPSEKTSEPAPEPKQVIPAESSERSTDPETPENPSQDATDSQSTAADSTTDQVQAEDQGQHETERQEQNEVESQQQTATEGQEQAKAETQEQPKAEDQGETKAAPAEKKPWDGVVFKELTKKELVKYIELLVKDDDPVLSEKVSRRLRRRYDEIHQEEREEALKRFVEEGNDADHFAYRFDELDNRFDGAHKLIRDRKSQYLKNLEHTKEKNYQEKVSLLEELRTLVDEEETMASIDAVKKIQQRWKTIGQVPGQHVKTLWANYHALMDLYYDQRSIYFELKELDRKKNLEAKLDLCEKAENLVDQKNLKQAINELNELHEEFKHIGPVPKEDQQGVWDRFKAASDQVYARRKEFIKHLKKDLKENLKLKSVLADEVQQFLQFSSDRITEWNKKTKEILELQKKWETIGGLPREQAKDVNKKFWGAFKGFFQNKGNFFKQLEGEREVNLEKKKELVARAESFKDSTDWHQTAEALKKLQREWKNIGPVPEKYRNSIYAEFKKACDTFFQNKRSQNQEIEKSYIENLQQKQQICEKIEAMTTAGNFDLDQFLDLKQHFNEVGYVPAAEVKNIRNQFLTAADEFLSSVPEELSEEARQIRYDIQFEKLKKGPNSGRRIEQREQALRRDISALENDIATWKNNLEFLASSKQAEKVKKEFATKIDQAGKKLSELKSQMRALRQL